MIENKQFGADGTFQNRWKHQYDENNNLLEAIQYSADSTVNYKITYKYNVDKLLVEQTNNYGESVQKSTTFKYNKKNLLSAKKEYTSGERISAIYRYQYEFY